jgi:hypothetical protein
LITGAHIVHLVEPENAGGDWRSVLAIDIPGGWAVVCAHRMILDIHAAMRNGLCSDETLSCIWEASYLVLYRPPIGLRSELRPVLSPPLLGPTCFCSCVHDDFGDIFRHVVRWGAGAVESSPSAAGSLTGRVRANKRLAFARLLQVSFRAHAVVRLLALLALYSKDVLNAWAGERIGESFRVSAR